MAEARALVCTLDGWSVVDTMVVPTKTPDKKLIFGRGTLEQLTGEPFIARGASSTVPLRLTELASGGRNQRARLSIPVRPQHSGQTAAPSQCPGGCSCTSPLPLCGP